MAEKERAPGEGGGAATSENSTQTNTSLWRRCQKVSEAPRLTIEQLRHRPGERHAEYMARLKAASIFSPWPQVLDRDPPAPLALGTGRELEARLNLDRCDLRTFRELIRRHVASPPYLASMIAPGAMRHNLNGQPVEPVSREHRHFAYKQRAKYRAGSQRHAGKAARAEEAQRRLQEQEDRAAVARAVVKKIRARAPAPFAPRANAALPTLRLGARS